jgi:hypothetical protein
MLVTVFTPVTNEKNPSIENTLNLDFMKSKSFSSVGALHPILFFAVMYVVVLLFSIFICSSLFYSCSSNSVSGIAKKTTVPEKQQGYAVQVSTAAVVR